MTKSTPSERPRAKIADQESNDVVDAEPHVLKLYDVVRTAHLERVDRPDSTTILYRSRRYDFDRVVAQRVNLRRAGTLRTFTYTLRNDVDFIEINEPLIARAGARSAAAMFGNRVRTLLRPSVRATVISYAIASKDPREAISMQRMRTRLRWRAQSLLIPFVWRRVERLAFGTNLSYEVYRAWFGSDAKWPDWRVIPALPASRIDPEEGRNIRPQNLVFLGDLSPRKGFLLAVDAWKLVHAKCPNARFTIVGRGVDQSTALALADEDDAVTVVIDPPRSQVFEALSRAKVLVLLSQRSATWREQVGLPIVEALSLGCTVVSTTESGLADWLSQNGHFVLAPDSPTDAIADSICEALQLPVTPIDVVAPLPARDGRQAAEHWLLTGEGSE